MQGIIVAIIVFGCICVVLYRIIQYFSIIDGKKNPCKGCALSEECKKKQENCIKK